MAQSRSPRPSQTATHQAPTLSPSAEPSHDNFGPFDPLNQPYGATPVDEDARGDLLPAHQHIATMAELNRLEAINITQGLFWVREQGFAWGDLLDQYNLREAHRHMFDQTWAWAGDIRKRETTIGIDPTYIQEQWKARLDDTAFHIENRTWTPAVTVLRLHHQTVAIHPFVNGNGRFARLMSDELAAALGMNTDHFTWGKHLNISKDEKRKTYLRALRELDTNRNAIESLLSFAFDPAADDAWL